MNVGGTLGILFDFPCLVWICIELGPWVCLVKFIQAWIKSNIPVPSWSVFSAIISIDKEKITRHLLQKQQGRVVQQIEENHLARIGDKDLVTQSEPIQKAYYQENDEVSNTSAIELRAWLKERAIVVEGSSVRPIFKFSQSGNLSSMKL